MGQCVRLPPSSYSSFMLQPRLPRFDLSQLVLEVRLPNSSLLQRCPVILQSLVEESKSKVNGSHPSTQETGADG